MRRKQNYLVKKQRNPRNCFILNQWITLHLGKLPQFAIRALWNSGEFDFPAHETNAPCGEARNCAKCDATLPDERKGSKNEA